MSDPLSKTAVPPPTGWTLRQAVEAFWPMKAQRLFKSAGIKCFPMLPSADELPAAVAAYVRRGRDEVAMLFRLLERDLIEALAKRDDLLLTGYDLPELDDRRHELDSTMLRQAARFDAQFPENIEIGLQLSEDRVRLYSYVEGKLFKSKTLSRARVYSRTARSTAVAKPVYTAQMGSIWLAERIRNWPHKKLPPTADECYRAAQQDFEGQVPKSTFNQMRREHPKLPQGWKVRGRRRKGAVSDNKPKPIQKLALAQ